MSLGDQTLGENRGTGRLRRAEAAVASARVSGAQRAATGLCRRSQAAYSLGHRDADIAAALAFHAHAVGRDIRLTPSQGRAHQLKQLIFVYRAAPQLEIHWHVP